MMLGFGTPLTAKVSQRKTDKVEDLMHCDNDGEDDFTMTTLISFPRLVMGKKYLLLTARRERQDSLRSIKAHRRVAEKGS
jgi:hypothetical protein